MAVHVELGHLSRKPQVQDPLPEPLPKDSRRQGYFSLQGRGGSVLREPSLRSRFTPWDQVS